VWDDTPVPRDLLLPDGDAMIALSGGLRIKRTLDGEDRLLISRRSGVAAGAPSADAT
jgi:hypothetical protein